MYEITPQINPKNIDLLIQNLEATLAWAKLAKQMMKEIEKGEL